LTVCQIHGGSAPQVKAAGERRLREEQARRAVATYGLPADIDPADALLAECHRTAGHVAWLRGMIADLDPDSLIWGETGRRYGHGPEGPIDVTDESATAHMWLDLYLKERAHLVKVCTAALAAGVAERQIRMVEAQAELLASGLRRMIDDIRGRLDLCEADVAVVTDCVAETLRRLDSPEPVGSR